MVVCRETAVLCGVPWFDEVFRQLDDRVVVTWMAHDGDALAPEQMVCTVEGPARPILSGERTALNFLQTLSGTAYLTSRYARSVRGTHTRLLDTRKTIPGLRSAQKYAVRCGGGHNHRMGLYDAILIKENHIAGAGSIGHAVAEARRAHASLSVEVEVEDLRQLREALESGADIVMLDNFSELDLPKAVAYAKGRAKLEVSGGFDLKRLARVAKTGVDYISVGALTKHIRAIDFSMRFV
jgi:nicotinate-nucleotide pyrophosphorylase (carboxylating)